MKGIDRMSEKKSRKTIRWSIVLVILVMIAYTITCYVIIDCYSEKPEEVDEDSNKEMIAVTLDHMTTLPLPDSETSAEWECGTFYSNISKTDMEVYFRRLSEAGWKNADGEPLDTVIPSGTTVYDLVNGDHLLQLMTFFEDTEIAFYNSILVYYDDDVSVNDKRERRGAMTKEEVFPLLQYQVDELSKQGVVAENKDVITGLFEIDIDKGYERLQLQAFAAFSDMGFTGCFLARKGIVTYVPGNLANSHVLDIDQDGSYEILDNYHSWKGNTFRLELVAYEYTNPVSLDSLTEILQQKYYTCFVPVDGYDSYKLNIDRAETITLIGETKDYGKLQVADGNFVIVGKEAANFLAWEEAFDQSRLSTIEKKIPDKPPIINIKLDSTQLNYIVSKSDWGGKTETTEVEQLVASYDKAHKTVPFIRLETIAINESAPKIVIDFGDYIPDTIKVYDAMLTEENTIRYKINTEQAVRILDDSSISFPLSQHFAYYFSSNSKDYDKEWRRLFQVDCTWGDKECTYAFLLNTKGKSLSGEE